MQMPDHVGDHVCRVKETEEPEVDPCGPGAHKSADQSQCAQTQVAYIDKGCHREQAEHLAVGVHNARHIVQRIHGEKEQREAESAFLDRAKASGHGCHPIAGISSSAGIIPRMQGPDRRCWLLFAALLVSSIGSGQTAMTAPAHSGPALSTETELHAVHNALFASFLPVDELPNDPKTTGLLIAARDAIWQQAGSLPAFRQLVQPFADLPGLSSKCGIAQAIGTDSRTSFAALDSDERQ